MASASQPSSDNPTGINQFKNCPKPDDACVEILIFNKELVSQMLLAEHGIKMRTVVRRRKAYGLLDSGATTRALPLPEKRRLVLDQLAKDPTGRHGLKTIGEGIVLNKGVHLTRSFICSKMRLHDPAAFSIREPAAKKIQRGVLTTLGPHHDKLAEIGFHIWGVCDKWSSIWLGLWVLPNNHFKQAIALLFLRLIRARGSMPIQMSTDRGSETTEVFGLANAPR